MLLSFRLKQVRHFDTLKAVAGVAAVQCVCALCEVHTSVQLFICMSRVHSGVQEMCFLLLCGGLNNPRYGLPFSGHMLGRFTYNILLCAHMKSS